MALLRARQLQRSDFERFDLILADGFDPDAKAGALDTDPFYQACRARLSDERMTLR